MLYTLSKIIDRFLDPIGFIWLILVLVLFHSLYKRQARQALFCGSLALFMTIIGGTRLPNWLLARMEQEYVVDDPKSIPECDAVVVLGSGHRFNPTGVINIEFNATVDRIIVATELVRLGKGKSLLIGGGYPSKDGFLPEGILVKKWLESWEVINKPILELGVNRNTRDEALHTAALAREMGWNKIILVTSASHMPRSVAVFKKVGLDVIPVGADFIGANNPVSQSIFHLIPSAGGFSNLKNFMHEQVGWWFYKSRGWI
ncbi:YdcF family protein [bacterium]|nr:YdcF family protein [bacterium]MDC0309001.1 YdcF family protein [bacterium]